MFATAEAIEGAHKLSKQHHHSNIARKVANILAISLLTTTDPTPDTKLRMG